MFCLNSKNFKQNSNGQTNQMDLVHSTNSHTTDYSQYSLDLNKNDHESPSQHNAYWQWQHSDGSSSDGFHQQIIYNANQWDTRSLLQQDNCTIRGMQSPPFRPKSAPESWNRPYFR